MPIIDPFPKHTLASAVATEPNRPKKTVTVERLDGLVQPSFRTDVPLRNQRVENARRPALFLEGCQDGFLVWRWHAESLDNLAVDDQLSALRVPPRNLRNDGGYR